jgi:5-methylcytosine-specific restriction protein A
VSRLTTLPTRVGTLDTRSAKPPPKTADPELLTPQHKAWRIAVCRRAHWQCEWVEQGRRCERRAPDYRMIADHIIERADGGSPYSVDNGQCLCTAHNTQKGLGARAKRMATLSRSNER